MRTDKPRSPLLASVKAGLFFLLAMLLWCCAPEKPELGLFLYNEADPYILEFGRQIVNEAADSYQIRVFDAGNSQPIQNQQLEDWLATGPSVVLVNPVDRLSAYALIQRLRQAGIAIIFFNREPLPRDMELWDRVWYVGAQAAQSGRLQAELVIELFGSDPRRLNQLDRNRDNAIQTVILKGEQGHQDAEIRTSEVLKTFAEAEFRIDVLALEVANWNHDQAYDAMGRILDSLPQSIELVISNNDAMALGAVRRMRQAGIFRDTNGDGMLNAADANWIPVVGIDGLKESETVLAEGYLYGTVKNDSLSMARAIVSLAGRLMGEPAEPGPVPLSERYIWVDYLPYFKGM